MNLRTNNHVHEEEYFEQIFKEHYLLLEKLDQWIKYLQITSLISLIIFLILFSYKISTFSVSWFYLLIPGLITIISYTIVLNLHLTITDILSTTNSRKTTILSYIFTNLISLLIIVYMLLFCFKKEMLINASWNMTSTPLYLLIALLVLFFIFVLPSFFQNQLICETVILACYIICLLSFLILINTKLDYYPNPNYFHIFTPLFVAIGTHLLYCGAAFTVKRNSFLVSWQYIISLLLFFADFILIACKMQNILSWPNWSFVLIFSIGLGFMLFEKTQQIFKEDLDSTSESSKNKTDNNYNSI